MKKILFCLTILILVIVISMKVNYKDHIIFSFGNNINSNYKYYYSDTRIDDIIDDIDKNILINDRYIQNILVKADYIYLDLNGLILNSQSVINIETLLEKIRSYTKEKMIVILRKEESSIDKAINKWIFKLTDKYDIMVKR